MTAEYVVIKDGEYDAACGPYLWANLYRDDYFRFNERSFMESFRSAELAIQAAKQRMQHGWAVDTFKIIGYSCGSLQKDT